MKQAFNPEEPIVIVDDEPLALESMEILFGAEGFDNIVKVSDPTLLMDVLASGSAALVLLDLIMPGLSGEALLDEIVQRHPDVPVIVVTARDTVSAAVSCMKQGAFDFIAKPVDPDRLLTSVRHALGLRDLRRENRDLRERLFSGTIAHPEKFRNIVVKSPGMRAVLQYVEAIARSNHPALIMGETGVGKELVARALHNLSARQGPFVSVNVAGLDDTLFADTLFGHVRGAFTGAVQPRSGLVSKATDGTLFLDEIGDLSAASQVKLLRLVQEAEYFPVGSDTVRRAQTRIVTATNRDLHAALADGRFRNDLFFRLSTHEIIIPPLRNRPEDIPALVEFFLAELCEERGMPKPEITDDLMRQFIAYDFPGNVRELKSMVLDALTQMQEAEPGMFGKKLGSMRLLQRGRKQKTEHPGIGEFASADTLPTIKQATHMLVQEAMRRAAGNQSNAARILGISQQALSKRLARNNPTNLPA